MRGKLRVSLLVFGFLLLIAGIWFLIPGFYTREQIGLPTTVLWRDDGAYIFVAVEKRIAHATRLGLLLEDATADLRECEYVTSKRLPTDFVLFRLQDGKPERHYLEDFEPSHARGAIYPYNNEIYYRRGTLSDEVEHPLIWRWTGTRFEKLTHNNAVQEEEHCDPAVWKKEGWTWVRPMALLNGEGDWGDARTWSYRDGKFGSSECSCSMTVKGNKLLLIFHRGALGDHRRSLALVGLNGKEETPLIDIDQSWRGTDKKTYNTLLQNIGKETSTVARLAANYL